MDGDPAPRPQHLGGNEQHEDTWRWQMAMEVVATEQKRDQASRWPGQLHARDRWAARQNLSRVGHGAGIAALACLPLGIKAVNAAAPNAGELVGNAFDPAEAGGPFPQHLKTFGLGHRIAASLQALKGLTPRSTAGTTEQNAPHRSRSGCKA